MSTFGVPEDEAIPVSELLSSAETSSPQLSASGLYMLLAARFLRSRNICSAGYAISAIGLGLAILLSRNIPWAVVCGIAGAIFKSVGALAEQKAKLAHRIAMEPRLVYWAYPHIWHRHRFLPSKTESALLTLHSRTGQQLEVSMPRNQLRDVVAYLTRHNSSIRVGAYDDTTHVSNEHHA